MYGDNITDAKENVKGFAGGKYMPLASKAKVSSLILL